MQKSNKATLIKSLVDKKRKKKWGETADAINFSFNVVDWGSLLHKAVWPTLATFHKIIKLYHEFVNRYYGSSIIVFGGYENVSSTKDYEHLRRLMYSAGYPNISVDLNNVAQFLQTTFLNKKQDKSQLIFYITETLKTGDADTEIVSSAIDIAITLDSVKVRVADIDVIVMLLYFYNNDTSPIISQSEYVKMVKRRILHLLLTVMFWNTFWLYMLLKVLILPQYPMVKERYQSLSR